MGTVYYELYPDQTELASVFDQTVTNTGVSATAAGDCTLGEDRLYEWTDESDRGSYLCYTSTTAPTMVWTEESSLVFAVAVGQPTGQLSGLYTWWRNES